MSHWIRWIIVAPVLMLVAGTMISSCGSSSGCFGSVNAQGVFIAGLCPQATPSPGYALQSINICPIFATPSPTGLPTPTATPKHPNRTPTATPSATPTACSTPAPGTVFDTPVNGIVQFGAQGVLVKGDKTKFEDITNAANVFWGSNPQGIVVNPAVGSGGIYQGQTQGCTCISASASSISSLQYAIQVGSPAPACGPCPTPTDTPTPTATATAAGPGAATFNYLMPTAAATGSSATAQWTFKGDSPVAGTIVPGTHGEAYFITRDAIFHAIDSRGHQIFDRPASGTGVAVAPDGTIVVPGTTDWLYGLTPQGVPRWRVKIGTGGVPLAADDSAAYVSVGDSLVSVSSNGQINWTVPASAASAAAIIPGGVVIASAEAVIAYSTTGSQLWSFIPEGGFAGNLAVAGTTVYCGSSKGTMYAVDSDTGAQSWSVAGAGGNLIAGPAIDATGQAYFGTGALYAVDSAGAMRWTLKGYAAAAGNLAVDAAGDLYVAAADGTITKIGADGTPGWSSHSAGRVLAIAASPSGEVYVASADGRVSALE
ncbi:MAG: PQQ-binding-like beta-propeller repeat protein [Candidatus Binataceae bacterium]